MAVRRDTSAAALEAGGRVVEAAEQRAEADEHRTIAADHLAIARSLEERPGNPVIDLDATTAIPERAPAPVRDLDQPGEDVADPADALGHASARTTGEVRPR